MIDLLKRLSETIVDSTVGLLNAWQRNSMRIVKIEAAKYYLKTVQAIRRHSLFLVCGLFCLFVLAAAVVVMPLAVLVFSPLSIAIKFKLVCGLAVLDVGIPVFFLGRFFSEKNWMKISRSGDFIADVIQKD